eukprot:TRINITY_DN65744_c2_g1_i1.p1 TRINITY_DN65744_c2_g1~~TRINITY_DN65744_c2_g1_i1.p1  ORF type:complete len:275 (+),score=5.38 TRINITY_DN65744_c2_g1_i1:81-905(+)
MAAKAVSNLVRMEITSAGIMHLAMNSPKVNSLTPGLMTSMLDCLTQAKEDDGVKGLLVSSDVPGVFSAGLDLLHVNNLLQSDDKPALKQYLFEYFLGVIYGMISLPKPVVAAVSGHAIAGGMVIACAADRMVLQSSKDAPKGYKLGLTELAVGVPFPQFVQDLVVRQLPIRTARHMIYSAQNVSSKEAFSQWGVGDEESDDPVVAGEAWLTHMTDVARAPKAFENSKYLWWKQILNLVNPGRGMDLTEEDWLGVMTDQATKDSMQAMVDILTRK